MNPRTGILKDYVENDSDLPVGIPLNYTIDQESLGSQRIQV